MPERFEETTCSQCGGSFGPGPSGYSHCEDHRTPAARALHRERALQIQANREAAAQSVAINSPFERHASVLRDIEYRGWSFTIQQESFICGYLQLHFTDPETGNKWGSRKWRLSPHMTTSEIVQTCLAAVLMAEEHEAREKFLYRGRAIYGPHLSVENLWRSANDLDRRPEPGDVA